MKTATIREVQHHFSDVLGWIERGEEVQITRRNKPVARLLPPEPPQTPVQWPDFLGRARAIWGDNPPGIPLSELVIESREERC